MSSPIPAMRSLASSRLFAGCFLVAAATVSAADLPALTFADALQRLEQHSPSLRAAEHALAADTGASDQAALWPNPELEWSRDSFGNDALTGTDGPATTLQLRQRLELSGKRGARVALADANRSRSALSLAQTRAELHAALHVRFTELQVAQKRALLAAEQLTLAQRTATAVSEKVSAGKVVPLEANKASITVMTARLERDRAERTLQASRQALAALWGASELDFGSASGDYAALPALPELADLQARFEQSPLLQSWQQTVAGQHAQWDLAKASAYPDVTLTVGQRELDDLGERTLQVGVSIPLPIFDRNQGGKTEALSRLQQAQEQQQAALVQARTDLQVAWQALQLARAEAEILRADLLPNAEAVFAAASEAYRAGKFGLLDVLDAQRTLFAVNEQHLQAVLSFHQRFAELERLIGAPLFAPESNQ